MTISKSQNKRIPISELNNKISVDQITGQAYMKGPVLKLKFPMIVVRHGQTDGNLKKVLQGQVDGPENQLNEAGKEEAKHTAVNLYNELKNRIGLAKLLLLANSGKIIILKSPITRAKETANFFIQYFQEQTGVLLRSEVEQDLQEMSFGRYDGFSLEEIEDEYFANLVIKYRTTQDATINWQGTGESFIDAVIRAKHLIERLNREYLGKIVIAFTHGTYISALRTILGDKALLKEDEIVAFRDHILGHTLSHWLEQSQKLIDEIHAKAEL